MNAIYQIFYDSISKESLDSGFIPYDNTHKITDIFENQVIIDICKNHKEEWKNSDYVGVLSWRFKEKTGIESKYLFDNLKDKSVYLLTPKIYMNYKSPVSEFGFGKSKELAQLFDKYKVFPFKLYKYNNENCINFCNYWVAKPHIFEDYVNNFLLKGLEFLRTNREAIEICSKLTRHRGLLYPSIVFFIEAFFQIYVHYNKIDYDYIIKDVNYVEKDIEINKEHQNRINSIGNKQSPTIIYKKANSNKIIINESN